MRLRINYVDSRFSVNVQLHSNLVTFSWRFFEFFPLHLLSFSALTFCLLLVQHAMQLDRLSRSCSTIPSYLFLHTLVANAYLFLFLFFFFIPHLTGDLNSTCYYVKLCLGVVPPLPPSYFTFFEAPHQRQRSPQAAHLSPFTSFSPKSQCNGISVSSFATVSRLRSLQSGTNNNNFAFKLKFVAVIHIAFIIHFSARSNYRARTNHTRRIYGIIHLHLSVSTFLS